MLVIGIDGGDKKIIESLDMPNLQKILNKNICLPVMTDLWSRGWFEILTGKHGVDGGAFYEKPKMDGMYGFTQSFGIKDYCNKKAGLIPLWELLNEYGKKVGFMNIPTTMPAPKVDGFFVSGAGGGYGKSGGSEIPEEACYPRLILNQLKEIGYIFDFRFKNSCIRDENLLFSQLITMTQKRTEAFLKLNRTYNIDFGFIAYMGPKTINYLAMSEIEILLNNNCVPENSFQRNIIKLYKEFDNSLGKLIDNIDPEYLMIVSDHGSSPYLHSINVNSFLQDIGLQKKKKMSVNPSLSSKLKKIVFKMLPVNIKAKVKSVVYKTNEINYSSDLAFGAAFTSGIYINDKKRFGGPVDGEREMDKLIEEIIEKFNSNDDAKKHQLVARVHRKNYSGSLYYDLLPDIWIEHPDTAIFLNAGPFIEPNKEYRPIKSLKCISRSWYTGIKGGYPLLCVDKQLLNEFRYAKHSNLTIAYRIIEKVMK